MEARASSGVDCWAINQGALNVELGDVASDTRSVRLRSGETLWFTFHAEPGPFGMLTLQEGVGAPRLLLVGPAGTSVSFAAARDDRFSFQFARDGETAASFTASCTRTRSVRQDPKRAPGARMGGTETLHATPSAEVAIDPPPPLADGKVPQGVDAAVAAPKQAGGAEVKLQWREERYTAGGHEGPLIDGNASGVEIGVSYKLRSAMKIGALAQFDPAAEVPFGGQGSLSDHGWLAGPVGTVHFAPGLVLEARAAWGVAANGGGDPTGAGAERRLLSARLANPQSFGAWRFTPSVSFNHLWEVLPTPGHPPAEAPAPHVIGSGRVDVSPELAYRMDLAPSTFIEPKAVVGGFWAFEDLTKLAPGVQVEPRLKAEAGVTLGVVDGPKLQALGSVEEGDGTLPDAWSGRVQFSVPLQ